MSKRKYSSRHIKGNNLDGKPVGIWTSVDGGFSDGRVIKAADREVMSQEEESKEEKDMKKANRTRNTSKANMLMKKEGTTMTANAVNAANVSTMHQSFQAIGSEMVAPGQFGDAGRFVYLNNKQLRISPEIQRKLDPLRVAEIVANYSARVCNPVKVNYRDGEYYIFDGMHTRAALMVLKGGDDFPVLCRVYSGMTKEDEARLFAAQFGSSAPVSMIYRLRALEVAKDPEVLDFLKVTRNTGFDITLGADTGANGSIVAVCAAYKAYGTLGSQEYGRMLTILHRTWAGENWSVSRFMLGGMARFMRMYEVEEKDFVHAFREVTQDQVTDEVRRFRGMTKDGAYASAIAEIFGRKSKVGLKAKKATGKATGKVAFKATVKSLNRSRR